MGSVEHSVFLSEYPYHTLPPKPEISDSFSMFYFSIFRQFPRAAAGPFSVSFHQHSYGCGITIGVFELLNF